MLTNEQNAKVALALGWEQSFYEKTVWFPPDSKAVDGISTVKGGPLPDFLHSWSACEAIIEWCQKEDIQVNIRIGSRMTQVILSRHLMSVDKLESTPMLALCEAIVAWVNNQCKGCGTSLTDKNRHYMDKRYCGCCKPEKEIKDDNCGSWIDGTATCAAGEESPDA